MAGEERTPGDPLGLGGDPAALVAEARRFGFVPTVTLLERLTPDAPRVGGTGPALEEAIRFRHDPAMTFSSADVSKVEHKSVPSIPEDPLSPPRERYDVTTTFLGLTGAATPLPMYFAEEVAHEDPDAPTRREFLDLFHHRILSLFFRTRIRIDIASEYLTDQQDAWSKRILAIAGVDTYEDAPVATRLPLWRLLRLAPLLAQHARTRRVLAVALKDVLGDILPNLRVDIEQFVGRWVDIEIPQRMKLGVQNTHLGQNAVVGFRIFDRGGKYRIQLGPVDQEAFRRFLPGGDLVPLVKDVVGLFTRDQLDFDLELRVAGTPAMKLSATERATRLGMDTFLSGASNKEERRIIVEVPPDGADEAAIAAAAKRALEAAEADDDLSGDQRPPASGSRSPATSQARGGPESSSYPASSKEGYHAR